MKLLIDDLDKLIKDKKNKDGVVHETGNINSILPFNSSKKTTIIKERFPKVLGEFTRLITELELLEGAEDSDSLDTQEENPILSNISKNVECNDEDARYDLNLFIEAYLFGKQDELRPIHPYMFNYYKLSHGENNKNKANEEKKIAKFISDVLILNDSNDFKRAFLNTDGEDLLTILVLENLGKLINRKKEKEQFTPVLSNIGFLFKEDFLFISKYRDYFLNHYPLLVHYYYFLYLSQLTVKFSQFEKADYTTVSPLYYALDWESLNKRRKAADGIGSYKWLKEKSNVLFVHIHTISQLSHNSINIDNKFMTYGYLNSLLVNNETDCQHFIDSINEWIKVYAEKAKLKQAIKQASTIDQAFKNLFDCLKEGMSTQVCEKYGKAVEDAAVDKFLKMRGNLGYTLNLTQDMLLLLTAISVKDKRIPLRQLFDEFEKRGVALDRYSIKEVTELLDSLNMIDKKSDSGDAQYVKPIL